MTYNRPEKVELPPEYDDKATNIYTRMALYFDLFIYSDNRDDTLLYQYLYHIIYMLACRKRYFVSWEDYDNFALYMATKVYLRYINPNHQGPEDRIKSVLNYCKNLLYPTKVDYQKDTFAEILGSDPNIEEDFSGLRSSLVESVQADHRNMDMIMEDLAVEFQHMPELITKEINKTPYANDKVMSHRLFMSVLITLTKGLTLSNSAKTKIQRRIEKGLDAELTTLELLLKERETSLTLWRLSPVYAGLVNMLAHRVRKKSAEAVNLVRDSYELSDDDVTAVLASAYGNVLRDDNEEF